MKALQAKAPPAPPEVLKNCHICGKQSYPWGRILHGTAHVCSKTCQQAHDAKRFT